MNDEYVEYYSPDGFIDGESIDPRCESDENSDRFDNYNAYPVGNEINRTRPDESDDKLSHTGHDFNNDEFDHGATDLDDDEFNHEESNLDNAARMHLMLKTDTPKRFTQKKFAKCTST